MAMECGPHGPAGDYPEQEFIARQPRLLSLAKKSTLLGWLRSDSPLPVSWEHKSWRKD
jgi:hypothetical protein